MGMGDWISLGGFLVLLAGFLIKYGELKHTVAEQDKKSETFTTKLELMEVSMRQKEDRERNDKRFEELFKSRNEHESLLASVNTNMENLMNAFTELKRDMRESLTCLSADVRGLSHSCGS